MSVILRDGTGTEKTARVNANNQLDVSGEIVNHIDRRTAIYGDGLSVWTGFVALTTTASFNALVYLKNTGSVPINLWSALHSSTVNTQWQLIRNPTGGTIITDANPAIITNRNFGSTKGLIADAFAASGDGKTITGGAGLGGIIGAVVQPAVSVLVLPPGASFCIAGKPSAAATVSVLLTVTQLDLPATLL